MIKGVNKQIIEVHETGSKCFEKAILFVHADYLSADSRLLKSEANRIIKSYFQNDTVSFKMKNSRPNKKKRLIEFLKFSFFAVTGAIAVIILNSLR